MRVIRAEPTTAAGGARQPLVAAALLAVGLMAVALIGLSFERLGSAGTMAVVATAALGIGVGIAMTLRIMGRDPQRQGEAALTALLEPVFDESYVLVLGCRLPGLPRGLAGLLVGPPGVRVLTARSWRGRYRLRGRKWQYDTRGPRGWINCRTDPSYEARTLSDAVTRWAQDVDVLPSLPIEPAVAFPRSHSKVALEEPETEVVTVDNAPWWAHSIGRVQRLDTVRVARFVDAVVTESLAGQRQRSPRVRTPGAA